MGDVSERLYLSFEVVYANGRQEIYVRHQKLELEASGILVHRRDRTNLGNLPFSGVILLLM